MNRIARRSAAMFLLVALLLGGISFFVADYLMHGKEWVMKPGSPHVYAGPNIGCGIVTDREGLLLLDTNNQRIYSPDASLRAATLHWVGDRYGYISAPAVATYAEEMAGYDIISGLYSYSGAGQTRLTLSAQVQKAALEAMGDKKGTVAVYNYKTGQLLCAVSTPTYDPDNPPTITEENQSEYEGVYMNRFTMSAYVPGSIFKVVTAAAALEEIPDILEQTFTCTGSRPYSPEPVTCSKAHGELDLYSALAQSCNCSFASIVDQLGPEKLQYYVEKYGVTGSVSFDGITTASGNFDLTNAGKNQIAWSGIGQHTDQVNPCAYLAFMGAIANGGTGVLPYVVEQVVCGDAVTYQASATQTQRILPEQIALELQQMMRNNVVEKYGVESFPDLTVCGKSGTAQADNRLSTGLFAGFVTDEAYPLAFIAIVEEGGSGRQVCVPILSEVLSVCKQIMDE
ncbi:MAG: penicillin-binding protein [Oscillospiraceae bacterium]|nr:penicillin-binding protein [Oscillospiraceae bacterium]